MERTTQVPPPEVLLTRDFILSLAEALIALDASRRETPNWLSETLNLWLEAGGAIRDAEGREIEIYPGIVDDAHGEDGSYEWVSAQKRRIAHPPKRRPRRGLLLRLQLYFAGFAICAHPFGQSARALELAKTRVLLRRFSPIRHAQYVQALRSLRLQSNGRISPILYSRSVRFLRLRFAADQQHWEDARSR